MQYEKSIVAEKALGWKPQFTVEQGLRETIDWFDTYPHPYM
jgi:nucleoside-diphosphate-sugar epimerase